MTTSPENHLEAVNPSAILLWKYGVTTKTAYLFHIELKTLFLFQRVYRVNKRYELYITSVTFKNGITELSWAKGNARLLSHFDTPSAGVPPLPTQQNRKQGRRIYKRWWKHAEELLQAFVFMRTLHKERRMLQINAQIPALYSERPAFESRTGDWLSSLRLFVVYLSPPRQTLR